MTRLATRPPHCPSVGCWSTPLGSRGYKTDPSTLALSFSDGPPPPNQALGQTSRDSPWPSRRCKLSGEDREPGLPGAPSPTFGPAVRPAPNPFPPLAPPRSPKLQFATGLRPASRPLPPRAPPRVQFLLWPRLAPVAPPAAPPSYPPRALAPPPAPPSAPAARPTHFWPRPALPPRVLRPPHVSSLLPARRSGWAARELLGTARWSRVAIRQRPQAAVRGCWWWAAASPGWERRRGSAAAPPCRPCGFWRPQPVPVAASARSAASVTACPGAPSRNSFPEPLPGTQSVLRELCRLLAGPASRVMRPGTVI